MKTANTGFQINKEMISRPGTNLHNKVSIIKIIFQKASLDVYGKRPTGEHGHLVKSAAHRNKSTSNLDSDYGVTGYGSNVINFKDNNTNNIANNTNNNKVQSNEILFPLILKCLKQILYIQYDLKSTYNINNNWLTLKIINKRKYSNIHII